MKVKNLKVFLVSSNPAAEAFWKDFLELNQDDQLYHWKDGKDSLAYIRRIHPDLVIVDDYFSLKNNAELTELQVFDRMQMFSKNMPVYYVSPTFAFSGPIVRPIESRPCFLSNLNETLLLNINRSLSEIRGNVHTTTHELVA